MNGIYPQMTQMSADAGILRFFVCGHLRHLRITSFPRRSAEFGDLDGTAGFSGSVHRQADFVRFDGVGEVDVRFLVVDDAVEEVRDLAVEGMVSHVAAVRADGG